MFDLTSEESFLNVESWFKEIKSNSSSNVIGILVGNKCDLKEQWRITHERAQQFANSNNVKYIEVSAKTYENVEEAFLDPTEQVLKKVESGEINPNDEFGIKLGNE